MNDLPVCGKCGWYVLTYAGHRCRPEAGAAAYALARAVGDVPATKLGWGDGRVTFEIDEDFSVGFDVSGHGTFNWRHTSCIGELGQDAAVDLVKALKAWADRHRAVTR